MKVWLFLIVNLAFSLGVSGQDVQIEFLNPTIPYQIIDSSYVVSARIVTNIKLASVKAVVASREFEMVRDDVDHYYAILSLKGLPQDTLQLNLIATDNGNNTVSKGIAVIYYEKPLLKVYEPKVLSTGTPVIRVKAECNGYNDTPCSIAVGYTYTTYLEIPPRTVGWSAGPPVEGSVDIDVELPVVPTAFPKLTIQATDGLGNVTTIYRDLFSAIAPAYEKLFQIDATIPDHNLIFDNSAIVAFDSTTVLTSIRYHSQVWDIKSQTSEVIPFFFNSKDHHTYLDDAFYFIGTPNGFFDDSSPSGIYSWKDGKLNEIYHIENTLLHQIKSFDRYVSWSVCKESCTDGTEIHAYDTDTETTEILTTNGSLDYALISGNAVIYSRDGTVFLSEMGVSEELIPDGNSLSFDKESNTLVYWKPAKQAIASYNLTSKTETVIYQTAEMPNFNVAGSYVFYEVRNQNGLRDIWGRDVTNDESIQITSTPGLDEWLSLITPTGFVIIASSNGYFLGSLFEPLMTITGGVPNFWKDGKWYAVIGTTVFRVNEDFKGDIVLSSGPEESGKTFSVFPNPASSKVNVQFQQSHGDNLKDAGLFLIDNMGRVIKPKTETTETSIVIDVNGLRSGLYLLRINLDEETITTRLVIK